jgi:GTP-binding protein
MIDRAVIYVRGGQGGDGAISFRREKFVPLGGPDGGDGGYGGNVIIKAELSVTSLREFRHKRTYRAGNGKNGQGQKKHGANGTDTVISVPVGTMVFYKDSESEIVADLKRSGEHVIVAKGGRGGLGNTHYSSSINQAPQIAQRGESGEERNVILELRLIADVGIIGFPNVGKSTLLTAASAARPEIASYPFTTREPVLGVVEVSKRSFVLAEIPGLIEEAHLGRGLGHDFLRHSLRTRMLLHLVDGSSISPVDNMIKVNNELSLFDSALGRKPQLVAVNKIDLPDVAARQKEIKEAFRQAGVNILFISAATGRGVDRLMAEVAQKLEALQCEGKEEREVPRKVFRPQPRGRSKIMKEGDTFIITALGLDRLMAMKGVSKAELRAQLKQQLARAGVVKELEKAGIKRGDKVRCGELEWEW